MVSGVGLGGPGRVVAEKAAVSYALPVNFGGRGQRFLALARRVYPAVIHGLQLFFELFRKGAFPFRGESTFNNFRSLAGAGKSRFGGGYVSTFGQAAEGKFGARNLRDRFTVGRRGQG